MPKDSRQPVPYADVVIGHWYQARFEFKVADKISPVPPAAAEQSTSVSRTTTRNKSHRVVVLRKIPGADNPLHGHAICLFLTSFGGRLEIGTTIPSSLEQLKYLAVNATVQPPTSPYSRIPITVRALYGFMEFTSEYFLPIATGGDAAIVRMREAGKANADISSPDWAIKYIRRLKTAWMTWLMDEDGNEAMWVETAKAVTAEFGHAVVGVEAVEAVEAGPSGGEAAGTKRLLDDAEEEEEEGEGRGDEGGGKGKAKGKAKRQRSGPRWLDGSNESDEDHVIEFEDSGIHLDMDDNVVAETAVHQQRAASACAVLVSVGLFHLNDIEDHIDEEVDFDLLNAVFHPIR